MDSRKGLSTRAVHAGEEIDGSTGAVTPAIHRASTFAFESVEQMARTFRGEREAYIYTRYANPTTRAVERKLASLEGCDDAVLFSSGMGAVATVLVAFSAPGKEILIARDVYGGTYQLACEVLRERLGVNVRFVEGLTPEDFKRAVRDRTAVVFVESPTNPLLKVVDLRAVSEVSHEAGALLVVDNTFATPINQNPARLGADLVVHSGSKYLGGHSDIIAGAVAGPRRLTEALRKTMRLLGTCIDPQTAWLMGRSMKTLELRVERQNQNASALARFLADHPKVLRVHYPGLGEHEGHKLACEQMRGFGGVLSFELDGAEAVERFAGRLELVTLAPSLGGVDTLLLIPAVSSHIAVPRSVREKTGITDGLVRLAVGVENVEDLREDIERALEAV